MKTLKEIILGTKKSSSIDDYLQEKLTVNSQTKIDIYNYHPTDKDLIRLIEKLIKQRGQEADLNDIDTSKITDMSQLFELSHFNGDISKWNVSNVKTMNSMFKRSKFNGNISNWDVSNVEDMDGMFAWSNFDCSNGDISNWEPSKDVTTRNMFIGTPKQKWKNIPKWIE